MFVCLLVCTVADLYYSDAPNHMVSSISRTQICSYNLHYSSYTYKCYYDRFLYAFVLSCCLPINDSNHELIMAGYFTVICRNPLVESRYVHLPFLCIAIVLVIVMAVSKINLGLSYSMRCTW